MQTESIFIAHPTNNDQLKALTAVVKALKVKFELKKNDSYTVPINTQTLVLNRLKTAKEKDYITVEESSSKLKKKYGF